MASRKSTSQPPANITAEDMREVISSQEDDNLEESILTLEEQDIKQRSITGVLSYVVRTFALYGIAVIANFLLAAFLEPSEYGVYFVVTAALGLITFLSDIGLAAALIQKKEEPTVADMRTTFTVQQILALAILALVLALTPYWRNIQGFSGSSLWLLYVVAASLFVITFKTIPSILLVRKLRFDLLAIPAVVENFVFYCTATLLAWQGMGVASFLWAVILRDVVGVAAMYALQRWPIGIGISGQSLKELIRIGVKFQLNDLLARIKDDLFTVVVVGAWLNSTALGYIGWAKKYTYMPQQFTVNNITAITFPTYSRLQGNKKLLRKAIEKTLYFITLVNFPLLAGMTIFFLPLTTLISQYNKWTPIVPTVAFFAINIAWSSISTPLTNTLNAIGHVNKTLWLMIMWTVLTWTITPLMIWQFDYHGVAAAAAIIGASSIVTVWMTKQVVPFALLPNIWRQMVATFAMLVFGLAGMSVWSTSLVHMGIGILLNGLVFAIVFLLIGWNSLKKELTSLGIWPLRIPSFRSSS